VVLVEGAADAVAKARQLGFVVVTISNQSGVARGLFDEEAVHAVNRRLDQLLTQAKPAAVISRHEFCPFHPEGSVGRYAMDSELRKPRPGMLLRAAEALGLDLSRSWLIGDAPRDVEAGKAAGCRAILFTAPGLPPSPAAEMTGEAAQPDYTVSTLRDALDIIGREVAKRTTPTIATHPNPPPRTPEPRPQEPTPHVPGGDSPDTVAASQAAAVEQPPDEEPAFVARELPTPVAPAPAPPVEITPMPQDPVAHPVVAEPTVVPSVVPRVAEPEEPPRPDSVEPGSTTETLLQDILAELRCRSGDAGPDFSVSKMIAGITQIIAIALMFVAYLNRNENNVGVPLLIFALFFQNLTIALLIMGRQR
jgi:D-glycero-D-manno-heptose 1,7-bisphosphate phosphatase